MTGNSLLLDTNAAIALLNRRQEVTLPLREFRDICIPLFVLGELEHGMRNSIKVDLNLLALKRLLDATTLVVPDRATAAVYGALRTDLGRIGRPIPSNDLWIASQAVQLEIPLLTRDAHFQGIGSLETIRW